MRLSEFNASLPKQEEIERDCLKEELEICREENLELRNIIKHLLDYIKEEK